MLPEHVIPVPPRLPAEFEAEVRREAYAIFLARNGQETDHDGLADWFEAERRVRARHAGDPEGVPASPRAFEAAVATLQRKEVEATATPPTEKAVKAARATKKAKIDAAVAEATNPPTAENHGKPRKKK